MYERVCFVFFIKCVKQQITTGLCANKDLAHFAVLSHLTCFVWLKQTYVTLEDGGVELATRNGGVAGSEKKPGFSSVDCRAGQGRQVGANR